ncbi:glycosyltransferase [Winogradskyella vincentii]|uniref:Glycosyltransferase n=1 Tax=Winogradskyella vincentii TaxID=2877122 RepID=A0ABS7XYE1_9FLAO|nr:glycosyltransferase [Winogradskyella vincentii]MCA0152054.1 glycosyltransferase [Winogradskyella vincentii]
MKIGVIIIFHNNEKDIQTKELAQSLKSIEDIELCFVDNESKDNTLEQLREIKETCANVSIVEIKKHISNEAAKRAGARYVFNNYNLKHIGFLDVNILKTHQFNLNQVLRLLHQDKDVLIEFDKDLKQSQEIKPTLFKSIFSILDFLKNKDHNKLGNSINLIKV